MLVPVILAGGVGTRLWPLSREAYPKQFISLNQGHSLFQQTLLRLKSLAHQSPVIVTNEQHRFLVAEQIRQLGQIGTIILEPVFKGTALAVALAAMQTLARYKNALLLVLPADHLINPQSFLQTVEQGLSAAYQGKLVTFGVVPTHPETGYGYIQKGPACKEGGFNIIQFVEKPPQPKAQHFFESGEYWWNSGIFLFSAQTFLQELSFYQPEIYHAAENAIQHAKIESDFVRLNPHYLETSPADSIDYALMEKTQHGRVFPFQGEWSDIGTWDALAKIFPADNSGNICQGDVISEKNHNCFIQAQGRLVVSVGLNNVVIIETADAVLVLDKNHAQDLKSLVFKMKNDKRKELLYHQRVNRPWGVFELVDSGECFQVKRITVSVGEKLSLQSHRYRSEHWVVVKGIARVTRGEEVFLLSENQSTYIPVGVTHRLENVGQIPLEIIEVQSGTYLGEDDIVRLEDQYGRLQPLT